MNGFWANAGARAMRFYAEPLAAPNRSWNYVKLSEIIMEINNLGMECATLRAPAWHIADDSGDPLTAPKSVLELFEIIMEINNLRMGCATLRAAAWKQAFPDS